MKEGVFQSSFVTGELSPHLHDRVDLDIYSAGASKLRNMIPLPHGPMTRRQGSQFLNRAPGPCRLIPFSFSVDQSFMLEFTSGKLRVYYQDMIVLNAAGNAPFETTHPFSDAHLPNLSYAQHRDWLYICCGDLPPKVLKRYGNNDWRFEDLTWTKQPTEWGGTNWPRYITFYEQRAVYAATRAQPQQLWFSRTALPENFTYNDGTYPSGHINAGQLIILDDHAFTYTIFSTDANGIHWMLTGASLMVGTAGAEYRVGSVLAGEGITPKNIRITPQTYYGSARINAVRAGSNMAFVPRSRKRVKILEYSIQQEQFIANDLTQFAAHIFKYGIKDIVVQSAPDTYVWCITDDGKLVGCTYDKQQKVTAWHIHETDGEYQAIGVLPSQGSDDSIYVCVKRGSQYFIELWQSMMEPPVDMADAWFVDSGLEYEGAPVSALVGATHLAGKEVAVLVDGWVHPKVTVQANGRIDLQAKGSRIKVGLPYLSDFVSVTPQSSQKLSVGQTRRINEIVVALEESFDFFYQANGMPEPQLAYAGPTPVMNKAQTPFTGHKALQVNSASGLTQQLRIWQDNPLPLTIRGILYYINPSGM